MNELAFFQSEFDKDGLWKDLIEHPDFGKIKPAKSREGWLAEIKRLCTKIIGKKNLYNDIVNEIIEKGNIPDKEKKKEAIFKQLTIKNVSKTTERKKLVGMQRKFCFRLGFPFQQLRTNSYSAAKLEENFDIMYICKVTF